MNEWEGIGPAWLHADEEDYSLFRDCPHTGIVSISPTECQCMDCLRIWPKEAGFVSDFPEHDRG